jgi:predicted transcriptional regulator
MATLSVRIDDETEHEIDQAAALLGRTRSEHLRVAIENENRRALETRIQFLARELCESHAQLNDEVDGSIGDGL